MIRACLLACLTLALAVPAATAQPYTAPDGSIQLGLAGRPQAADFVSAHGRRPAVFQTFIYFGGTIDYAFQRAAQVGAPPMLHISTADGPGARETVSPRGIARGQMDHWLVALQADAAKVGGPVYVRPMGEMDGYWNQYSAYGAGGKRDSAHSTHWFKLAWRRIAIILRGGDTVDAQLRAQHLKPLGRTLPTAQVALLWCPQVAGAPNVPGNAPRAYWPGGRWVDWVATDFYSKFPNFTGLEHFYNEFRGKPFAFGEWAIWDSDNPGFVNKLFSWVKHHSRVRMMVYNQGARHGGPFDLARYPRSRAAIRAATRSARFGR